MLSNCTKCKDIPKLFGILELGFLNPDTEYRVYFTHLATGIETIYDITTDSNGLCLLRDTEVDFQLAGGRYEVGFVQSSRYYIADDETISIDGSNYQCLLLNFVDILDKYGLQEQFTYVKVKAFS